jgi:hypothetical protein
VVREPRKRIHQQTVIMLCSSGGGESTVLVFGYPGKEIYQPVIMSVLQWGRRVYAGKFVRKV